MLRRALPLVLLALAACPKPARQDDGASLLAQIKQGLADRDARLTSYRLSGVTRQQGLEASFHFEFRAPNRMRGEVQSPQKRTLSFDGQKLFELTPDARKLVTYEIQLPPEKSALYLAQTFAPLAPEGFRAPLLLREGVVATRTRHPRAPEAVELAVTTQDEAGQPLRVTYALRWPALDFLGKRMELGAERMEVRVDDEHCDPGLKMCFPRQLTRWSGETPIATFALGKIELNPPLPQDGFTLSAPEGFEAITRQLVESGPDGSVP